MPDIEKLKALIAAGKLTSPQVNDYSNMGVVDALTCEEEQPYVLCAEATPRPGVPDGTTISVRR